MIDLVQYRTSIGLFASVTSRSSKKRNTKLSVKTLKNSSKLTAKIQTTTKDEDVTRGRSLICLQLLTVVLCLHVVCSNQFLDTNTELLKHSDIFCSFKCTGTEILHCNVYGSVECWEILDYGDVASHNDNMLYVNYRVTLSYSDVRSHNDNMLSVNYSDTLSYSDVRSHNDNMLSVNYSDTLSYSDVRSHNYNMLSVNYSDTLSYSDVRSHNYNMLSVNYSDTLSYSDVRSHNDNMLSVNYSDTLSYSDVRSHNDNMLSVNYIDTLSYSDVRSHNDNMLSVNYSDTSSYSDVRSHNYNMLSVNYSDTLSYSDVRSHNDNMLSVNYSDTSSYSDVRSHNDNMLAVNYSDTLSYSDVSFKNRHHVNYNNQTIDFHGNRSEHGVLLPCNSCVEHSYFICQSICNGPVIIQSLEMCPYPGTCCYLLGNKGMHCYNGNPATGLNLTEEAIKKQRLCVLLVDGGSQALRYTISRIVLNMKLQNVDGQTRGQLCVSDKSLLYPSISVLPSLDGLSQAGLDMVWTKALQQSPVTSATAQNMKDMIYDFLVSDGLDIQLKNKKQRVQALNNRKKLLNQGQWDILYPRLNVTVDLESFDITLLCFVILNVFQFIPTSGIWSQDPPAGDVGIGDDILRLRKQRNKLAHSSSSGMDDNTFQTAWTEIRDVLVRLRPSQEFSDKIQHLHDCPVDPINAERIETLITDWKDHEDRLEKIDRDLKSHGEEIEETKNSVKKLREDFEDKQKENETRLTVLEESTGSPAQLGGAAQNLEDRPRSMLNTVEAWRKEDIYITKGVEAVKEKISSKGCVCVIGVPGAGKSTALHHAALSLQTDGFIVYLISGPKEFLKYYDSNNSNKKQVFVLDDALGVYSVDQGKVKLWQEHDEKVRNALGTNTKLLVSIRTQIFMYETIRDKDIVFLDKSETTDHVDYSDADYKLGIDDMRGMLTYYMKNNGTKAYYIDFVIKQVWGYTDKELTEMTEEDRQDEMSEYTAGVEFADCFPLLCGAFINTDFAKQNPEEFFTNPFPALTKVFQNIKTDNKLQFCALVLSTMFDGKLTDDLVSPLSESPLCDDKNKRDKDKEIRNYIMSTYKLKCPDDLEDLQLALDSLTGVYILHIGDTYKISHAVFHDIVTYLYNDPLFVFKYGTREFIRDRVRLNKDEQQHDPYVLVYSDDTNIERLADRLFRDYKSDRETGAEIISLDYYTWTGARFITENLNIHDDRLFSCLRRKFTDREQTDKKMIDDLFTQCMWTVLDNRHTYKHGDVPSYKLIELCLQREADCSNMYIDPWYPLHLSVMAGSLQLTQLLLQHGADKRRVDIGGDSVLHYLCRWTSYNRLDLIKLLTQDGDLSLVKYITSDKQKILQILIGDIKRVYSDDMDIVYKYNRDRRREILEALDSDSLQLDEVLSDNSIKVLTTDKHKMKHFVESCKGKLNLVKLLPDNVLTHVDRRGRNILHYLADDSKSTSYVLDLMSDTKTEKT